MNHDGTIPEPGAEFSSIGSRPGLDLTFVSCFVSAGILALLQSAAGLDNATARGKVNIEKSFFSPGST